MVKKIALRSMVALAAIAMAFQGNTAFAQEEFGITDVMDAVDLQAKMEAAAIALGTFLGFVCVVWLGFKLFMIAKKWVGKSMG